MMNDQVDFRKYVAEVYFQVRQTEDSRSDLLCLTAYSAQSDYADVLFR